jgi:ribosomal-protein-alanine N-acetyltransferase
MAEDSPDVPELLTPRLRLRRLEAADAAGLHLAYGDAASMRFWDSLPSADAEETARRVAHSVSVSPVWHAAWAVLGRADGGFLGMVNYHARQPWNRRLAIGWIVVPGVRRQGFAREAVQALIGHCFGELEAHRIEAEIQPGNDASAGLATRLGFRREGLLRDRLQVGGKPRSVEMWALLRPGAA